MHDIAGGADDAILLAGQAQSLETNSTGGD
jgi:hypothetical protein